MTSCTERQVFTRSGVRRVRVRVLTSGAVADLVDGRLTAFGETEDDAVARLARAVDAQAGGAALTG